MTKFCAECGFALSPSAAFCGGCGGSVDKKCPTCGQAIPTQTNGRNNQTSIAARGTTAKVKSSSRPRNKPIYGPRYNEEYDCPNCGSEDQNYEVCKQCGEDNG